uniref:PfkB family carbohydrate kinase n=1 Tax=Yoonia sp. TaxID=2212373 RepID=UPI004047726C
PRQRGKGSAALRGLAWDHINQGFTGAQGVTVLTRDGAAEVPAVKATVVDTVGAGDTFSAGFLADLHKAGLLTKSTLPTATMHDLTRAAGFGARVAAITVARAGANPPWAAEL